ncbi:MAG TPA: serine hydrolase [Pyrinomonadaceae bacterium]|jgi:CubicO group peptidase (beta-lactamase class C family)|nr:serine hydrolase [Pyrinomonadaceae bacterium]
MRKKLALQRGLVLPASTLALLVFSLFGLDSQRAISAQNAPQSTGVQNEPAAVLTEKIERIENGLLLPTYVQGQAPQQMKLADRMQFYRTPGVSIAVINNNRIEWARGYGLLEAGGKERVTTATMFQAASISKPVTAMAALALVERGRIKLDEDVNQKLTSWKVPENEFTKEKKVTLRGLLTHSAGLTVQGFLGYAANEQVPTLLQILEGQKPANSAPIRVDIVPGSAYRYSGGGYVVLQQLLMDVTGKPFLQFMQETVLRKLGMTRSTFEQPLAMPFASTAAAGHLPDGKEIEGKWFVYPEMAPAGLWTTPTDLARFIIEILESRQGRSQKVLSRAVTNQMLTPQIEGNGLGLLVAGQGRTARFSFNGSNVGFKCYMVAYMESGQGAVVMTNSENGAALVLEILRSIAKEYGWPDFQPKEKVIARVDPKTLDAYVGQYEIAPNFILTVTKEEDRLISQATGQPRAELFPESENKFFLKDADAQFTFVRDEKGNVIQVNIRRGAREFQARKIK